MTAGSTMAAEAAVKRNRAELAETLDRLKDNLQPSHLLTEALDAGEARVHRLTDTFGRFASTNPVSGVIIGMAALLLGTAIVRRRPPRRLSRRPAF